MAAKHWKIDATHSSISFLVRHMLVSRVQGTFTRWSGDVRFAEATPASASVVAHIDAASIDTHQPARDEHLRTSDFLDIEQHPTITFRSTAIEPRAGGRELVLTGELTLRGVTRTVSLTVEYGGRMRDPGGLERVGFTAVGTISRKAFGMTFNQVLDCGGLALGDKLEIHIDVAAIEVPAVERPGQPAPAASRRPAAVAL